MNNLDEINFLKAENEKLKKELDQVLFRKNNNQRGSFDIWRGKVFEDVIEKELKEFFLQDTIVKFKPGAIQVPDFEQIIENDRDEVVGKIFYETKNAEWENQWIKKLANDVEIRGYKYGILVATDYENKFGNQRPFFQSEYQNVWVCSQESYLLVGYLLRALIIQENDFEKKLDQYLGNNKDYQIEKKTRAIIENFKNNTQVSISKQLDDLEGVEHSLIKAAEKVEKAKTMIRKRINRDLKNAFADLFADQED